MEELYKDESRKKGGMGELVNKVTIISRKQIEMVVKELPKGKACGVHNICAELLQCMDEKGMEIITNLINKTYNTGYIPEEF